MVHKSHVVGSGVEILHAPEAGVALPNRVERGRYILCLGRRDATKGVDLLVDAFSRSATLSVPSGPLVRIALGGRKPSQCLAAS
jgi:hypothetical protein